MYFCYILLGISNRHKHYIYIYFLQLKAILATICHIHVSVRCTIDCIDRPNLPFTRTVLFISSDSLILSFFLLLSIKDLGELFGSLFARHFAYPSVCKLFTFFIFYRNFGQFQPNLAPRTIGYKRGIKFIQVMGLDLITEKIIVKMN